MDARATLTIRDSKGGNPAFSIYRHEGGSPDNVLHGMGRVFTYAWRQPRFEAADFAAAIIAAWKQRGGGIYLIEGRDSYVDTSYHYEIYPDDGGRVVIECYRPTMGRAWQLVSATSLYDDAWQIDGVSTATVSRTDPNHG